MKMVWMLKGARSPLRFTSVWQTRGKWPTPMGSLENHSAKLFVSRLEAEEFLFQKQIRKGRDVAFVHPARVHLKTLKKYGYRVRK